MKNKVLITGANGFIGSYLCNSLKQKNIPYTAIIRKLTKDLVFEDVFECDLTSDFNLIKALKDCHTVVHCAGKAHNFKNNSSDKDHFNELNHLATKKLAIQASNSGVKKFIYISTAGVMGLNSEEQRPFKVCDQTKPQNLYSFSKLDGENSLIEACKSSDMNYTIIRPPMVYGFNAPGNWLRLISLINLKIPLPFKNINNKRSFVFIGNLCDLIMTILNSEKSINKIFFVSDDEDISTSDLIDKISRRLKIFPRIFYLNKKFILFFAKTVGKKSVINQLFESFQIDLSFTKETLEWRPKYSIDEGIEKSLR